MMIAWITVLLLLIIIVTTVDNAVVKKALTYDDCNNYEIPNDVQKLIITQDKYRNPPLLLSYPGSGNTWQRLIIEHLTRYCTGSIYNDNTLKDTFPCESFCDNRAAVIKGHPEDFVLESNNGDPYLKPINYVGSKRCKDSGKSLSFNRVIVITRDPFRSLPSLYQFQTLGSHNKTIANTTTLDGHMFATFALKEAKKIASSWDNIIYPYLQLAKPSNYMIIRYEDLLQPGQRRYDIMRKLHRFIMVNVTAASSSITSNKLRNGRTTIIRPNQLASTNMAYSLMKFTPLKEQCAFVLSDRNAIHRTSLLDRSVIYQTKSSLICSLWNQLQLYCGNFTYLGHWSGGSSNRDNRIGGQAFKMTEQQRLNSAHFICSNNNNNNYDDEFATP